MTASHVVIEVGLSGREYVLTAIGPYANWSDADADAERLMELCDWGGNGTTYHAVSLTDLTTPAKAFEEAQQ